VRPKKLGHIRAQFMHGRHDHVARVLVIQLLDALAEIRFHHRDAARLDVLAHLAFIGEHGFAFDERGETALGHQLVDDLVVLLGGCSVMHDHAVRLGLSNELVEIIGEM
jgi:hypothetical protein